MSTDKKQFSAQRRRETLIPKVFRATGSAAMAEELAFETWGEVLEVRVLATGTVTGSMTIAVDHKEGAAYDFEVATPDLNGLSGKYAAKLDWRVTPGSKVKFTWANGDSATWGLEVLYRDLV